MKLAIHSPKAPGSLRPSPKRSRSRTSSRVGTHDALGRFMKSPGLDLVRGMAVVVAAAGLSAQAAPIRYLWDDHGFSSGIAGVGEFTLDLPSVPADTRATAVAGSGPNFGPWGGVNFVVAAGAHSSLTISNLTGGASTFTTLGDVATASSSSAQEWLGFVDFWTRLGVDISVAPPATVPDTGPSLPFTVATLVGLCAYAHSRRRVTGQPTVGP